MRDQSSGDALSRSLKYVAEVGGGVGGLGGSWEGGEVDQPFTTKRTVIQRTDCKHIIQGHRRVVIVVLGHD